MEHGLSNRVSRNICISLRSSLLATLARKPSNSVSKKELLEARCLEELSTFLSPLDPSHHCCVFGPTTYRPRSANAPGSRVAWGGPSASEGRSTGPRNLPPASCPAPLGFLLLVRCVRMGGCSEGLACVPNAQHAAQHSLSTNFHLRNK